MTIKQRLCARSVGGLRELLNKFDDDMPLCTRLEVHERSKDISVVPVPHLLDLFVVDSIDDKVCQDLKHSVIEEVIPK